MLTAELLQQVFEDSFKGRTPHEVLTLVGYELPALDDHEEWESEVPMLSELELVTNALAQYVAEKCEGHPLSMFTTGLALGYLCANREVLEGVQS